jgi:creatinine amidohydrolase
MAEQVGDKPALMLEELSTTELDVLRDEIELVIIPVGSLEQHGPNLALCADTVLAKAASRIVAEALYPKVLVAPAVRWGVSYHHMDFVGTVTLRPDTFVALLLDIVSSLCEHGFRRVLFVNGHSGNRASLETATLRACHETEAAFVGTCQYFDLGDQTGTGHAARLEVSYAMYLAPHIVKYDSLADGQLVGPAPLTRRVYVPWRARRTSRNGPSGPLGDASAEIGRELLRPSLEGLIEVTRTIIDEGLAVDEPRFRRTLR